MVSGLCYRAKGLWDYRSPLSTGTKWRFDNVRHHTTGTAPRGQRLNYHHTRIGQHLLSELSICGEVY